MPIPRPRHVPVPSAPRAPAPGHLGALVAISGDDVYEDLFTAASALRSALTDEGFATRVHVGTAALEALAETAQQTGVVVLYTALGRFTDRQRQVLDQAVRGGCGLVALHSSAVLASPPDQLDESDRLLADLIGGRYVSHGPPPHESRFQVRLDPGHEVTAGIGSFEVTHEHYRLATAPDVRVIGERETAGGAKGAGPGREPGSGPGTEPLVHVRRHGDGRVCYVQLGHDMRVWGEPAMRLLVRRAARWACRPDGQGY